MSARPPALADRPPAATVAVVLVLAAACLGLLATRPDMAPAIGLVTAAAVVLAGALLAAAGRTAVHQALASVLFVLAAAVTAGAVAAATLPMAAAPTDTITAETLGRMVLASVVVLAAGAGATGALAVARAGTAARGAPSLLRAATASCLALVGAMLVVRAETPGGAVDELLGVLPDALQVQDPASSPAFGGFLVLGGVGALAVGAALVRLPLAPVAPRDSRRALVRTAVRVAAALRVAGIGGVLIGGAFLLAELVLGTDLLAAAPAGLDGLLSPAVRDLPRWLLLEVAVGAAVLAGLTEWLHRLGADAGDGLLAIGASGLGGAALAAGLVVGAEDVLAETTAQLGKEEVLTLRLVVAEVGLETLLLGTGLLVCGSVALVLWVGGLLGTAGALPGPRGPAVLGAAGLTLAAVVGGHLHEPSVQAFVIVGLAVVLWDVATFGQVLGRDVGVGAATGRVELVHTGGVLSIGLGAALVVFLAQGETAGAGSPTAGLVALAGVALVAVGLYR